MTDYSLDPICRGEIVLAQPKTGYRFNVDAPILADFVVQKLHPPLERIVDLGAGCGVVGLLIGKRWPKAHITLVEIQEELAKLAESNVVRNHMQERSRVLSADLKALTWQCGFPQLAVTNPPFFKRNRGRVSPNSQKAIAKVELECNLEELLEACAIGLPQGGHLMMIHEAKRTSEILEQFKRRSFGCNTLRKIQPLPDRPCTRVLLHAIKGGKLATRELPPLVIETRPGEYSAEMRCILKDD